MLAIPIVAALDDGRYHWFPVPWWVCVLGYVLFLVGFGIDMGRIREQVLRANRPHLRPIEVTG